MRNDLVSRDRRSLAALQKLRFSPATVVTGSGCELVEEGGRRLLDFSASWGAASLGYGHPRVIKAVTLAIREQAGASVLSAISAPAIELAETLLGAVPGVGERKVWLGHSGSDANETIMRALAAATGRNRWIAFIGAYHGGTIGSMSVSGHPAQHGISRASGLLLLPFPNAYRPQLGSDPASATLSLLDMYLSTTCPANELAGIFLEPIQSDGGMIVPPAGFISALADRCRVHGIPLICDEVKVGVGRTGLMWAFEHEGVTPDFVALGKGLGAGLPISAVIGPAAVMDYAQAFAMQTTHGNPVSASAALAVLRALSEDGLLQNATEVGAYLCTRIKELQRSHPLIGDIRGRGLAIGIELVRDRATREPARRETAAVVYRAWELGLLLYYVGVHSNVLELTPPLTLSRQEAERGISILDQAFTDVAAGKVDEDKVRAFSGW